MKVIETEYKGYRFRSRLEARWAVFFDTCNVKWEYEPEGFDLGDGLYYLPDFLLHDVLIRDEITPIDLWIEVKGRMSKIDAKKIEKFAMAENPILIVTNILNGETAHELEMNTYDEAYYIDPPPFNFYFIDGDYFGAFHCINKQGRLVIKDHAERCIGEEDLEATEKAYRIARQARFEKRK